MTKLWSIHKNHIKLEDNGHISLVLSLLPADFCGTATKAVNLGAVARLEK